MLHRYIVAMSSPQPEQIPKFQQAWLVMRRGNPEGVLSFRSDVPVPSKLGKGEVLVRVQAAALNPVYVFALSIKTCTFIFHLLVDTN